ncbi:N-acetyl-beta-D-glucosaminidase [Spirochaetia bacterium]|nr:N-acetyl-beta-D-glucosaminidase [Spirochaetia bacterium]
MAKVDIQVDDSGLLDGIGMVTEVIGRFLEGVSIRASRAEGGLTIEYRNKAAEIGYGKPRDLYRALALLSAAAVSGKTEYRVHQNAPFETIGIMYDCSRNSVPTVETIRQVLIRAALSGYNMFMLYTEDTYEIPEYPAFGHFRGRYSAEELRRMDDFAFALGIELVPCIQTLAHISLFLRWDSSAPMSDTGDILYVGAEETNAFVRAAITAASSPLRSKRIHLGMDEAHSLGLGRRLSIEGYETRLHLMQRQLNLVAEICSERGLKPMIWGDMPFRENIPGSGYYTDDENFALPKDTGEMIPDGVQVIYWDYYHNDKAFYDRYIRLHREVGIEPVFAGGLHSWSRFVVNIPSTILVSGAAIASCKENGLKELFVCHWQDNGGDAPAGIDVLGFMIFSEMAYTDVFSEDALKGLSPVICGEEYATLYAAGCIDVPDEKLNADHPVNIHKTFLYQDPLLGKYDLETGFFPMADHYKTLAAKLYPSVQAHADGFATAHVKLIYELSRVLELKADFGARAKKAYDSGDRDTLTALAEIAGGELQRRVKALHETHRTIWLSLNKPFGWEAADIKYGGILLRLEYAAMRLRQYLSGEIKEIPELAHERLLASGNRPDGTTPSPYYEHVYTRMVSMSDI